MAGESTPGRADLSRRERCLSRLLESWTETLARTQEWTAPREPTPAEEVFLALVSALSAGDAAMCAVVLAELPKRPLPRLQWTLPEEVMEQALGFAAVLDLGGLFTVPQPHDTLVRLLKEVVPTDRISEELQTNDAVTVISTDSNSEELQTPEVVTVTSTDCNKDEVQTSQVTGTSTDSEELQASDFVLVTSADCDSDEPEISELVMVSISDCQPEAPQTSGAAMLGRAEAQSQLWEGVRRDDRRLLTEAVLSGADLEETRGDWSPLARAASKGREEAVRTLLALGAAVEGGGGGATALHFAAARGHLSTVRLLVEAGADPGAMNRWGSTALDLATAWGHAAVAEFLQAATQMNSAASEVKDEPMRMMTAASQRVEVPQPQPTTTYTAAQTVDKPLPTVTRSEAQRLLWEGVTADNEQLIVRAVRSGADVEEVRGSWTPLTMAAMEGQAGAVGALIALGAEVDRTGDMGLRTALHWAAYWGHLSSVRLLVAARANHSARDRWRETPLDLALRAGRREVAQYLRSLGP